MQGTSIRSLFMSTFFHTVIFLYLLDSSEKTSYMIICSNCVALCIEYWKLQRACHFKCVWTRGHWIPAITWNIYDDITTTNTTETDATTVPTTAEVPTTAQDTIDSTTTTLTSVNTSAPVTVSRTDQHDEVAVTHLLYIVVPLVIGYSMYSYLYLLHKSYYSWIIKSLVGFVYAFGFILMTPQVCIYIVTHLYYIM